MHSIEEKGAVSTNGIGLKNGLSNKDTTDTWADLNNAIDNEINGCTEDSNGDSSNINTTSSKNNDSLSIENDKPEKIVVDLESTEKVMEKCEGKKSNGEGVQEKDIELPLVDDEVLTESENKTNTVQNDTGSPKKTVSKNIITEKSIQLMERRLNGTCSDNSSKTIDPEKVKKEEIDEKCSNNEVKKESVSNTALDNIKDEKVKSEDVKLEIDSKEGLSKTLNDSTKIENSTDPPNYETALQELSDITKYAKVLDDDHCSTSSISDLSQKRKSNDAPSDDTSSSVKKSKIDDQAKLEDISAKTNSATKEIKKQLKRISRAEMEDLVARKVVEVISCRSEIGDLRAKCDKYEEMNDKWKRKTQALQKMCQDLNTVIKRYIVDVKNKKDNPTPIKITRSVGLQVCADSKRRVPAPQQTPVSSQNSKQTASQKLTSTASAQRRVPTGNQTSNITKPPMQNTSPSSLPKVPSSTSPQDVNKSSKPLQSTVLPQTTAIMSNAGHRLMQSSPQHPLINKSPVNNQKGIPASNQAVTASPGTKGYLATQAVILQAAPSAIVTAAPSQINNSSYIRSNLPIASSTPGVVQQATSGTVIPNNLSSTTNSNKTSAAVANSNGLATATAASNQVIDLVELSDEEDSVPTPPVQTQPKAPVPAQRSQQQPSVNNRNGVGSNPVFQNQLPQHKPQQAVNRIHAPNTARSTGAVGGIRPMVFANQMANGVNVHRPPPLTNNRIAPLSHPAPLPEMPNPQPHAPSWKKLPPRPTLKISRLKSGIVLSWNMDVIPTEHAAVASYQIYAYQEGSAAPQAGLWKKVGDVKALPLPMACTLTQFTKGNKYHFAVRAQDVHSRVGTYSDPQSIALT